MQDSSSSSRRFRLRTTLIVPFILQIVAAVGLVGYLSFRSGQKAVEDLANQLMEEVGDRVDGQLQSYLATPQEVSQNIADAVDLGLLDLEDNDQLRRYLLKQFQQFPSLSWVVIGTEQPNYVDVVYNAADQTYRTSDWVGGQTGTGVQGYVTDMEGNLQPETDAFLTLLDYDHRQRPWYQDTQKAGKPFWLGISVTARPSILVLSSARPLYDRQNQFSGVLLVDYSLAEMNSFLSQIKVGKTGKVLILEQDGSLVASSTGEDPYVETQQDGEIATDRLSAVDSQDPLTADVARYLRENQYLTADTNLRQTFRFNDVSYFLQLRPYRDPQGIDWLIVTAIPELDFMAQINQNARNAALLCLGALGLAILSGVFTTRLVTRPILRIADAAKEMSKGHLNQHVDPSSIVEVDKLAGAFNSMAGQLKKSFSALQQSEATNRAIVTTIPDLMIRARGDGTYLDIPQGPKSAKSSLPGQTIHETLPPDLAALQMHTVQQALDTKELQVYEQRLMINDQVRDEEVRILVLGKDEVLIMVRDITERKQNEKLKDENLRMGTELNVARQIQQMILPKADELESINDLDIEGYMEPADEVGGDYYDVLETDGVVTIGIGDVTGHGLESGLLMLMTQTAVRTLKEVREPDPIKFLNTLNQTIYKNIQRMNSDRNLTLAILNYIDGEVSISGQHEETLFVRADGQVERIDTMDLGLPIGLDDDIFEFIDQVTVHLQPGDGIVLYTDGIPEAYNIDKKQYGMERFCRVISENWHQTPEAIKTAITADVRQYIGTQKVFDDITLVVLKRRPGTPWSN